MSARCYVCGSTENLVQVAPHNFTCEAHRVAGDHVVSMQTGRGGSSLAVCRCGWRSEVAGKGRYIVQDAKVRMHWHTMIRAAGRAIAADVRANVGLIFVASIAVSAALGSWLGGLS